MGVAGENVVGEGCCGGVGGVLVLGWVMGCIVLFQGSFGIEEMSWVGCAR